MTIILSLPRYFTPKPRPRLYHGLFGLAFCAIAYTALPWDDANNPAGRPPRRLAYLDNSPPKRHGVYNSSPEFTALVRPSEISAAALRGTPAYDATDEDDSSCDDVLLYMPASFAHLGHGAQLNSYLLAAMIATYTNKAMVLFEAPDRATDFESQSQFGCPAGGWRKDGAAVRWDLGKFPGGLERLVKHPDWLGSQCKVPCKSTYNYEKWDQFRLNRKDLAYYPKVYTPDEVKCVNDNGRRTNVLVVGGEETRDYFEGHFKERMLERPSKDDAYGWAMRLGAKPLDAEVFVGLEGERNIFDYVSALMARSAMIRFQPWIAADVEDYIEKRVNLPLDVSYDVIHVRRGDKLEEEFKPHVHGYWKSQGVRKHHPNYIPFAQYLTTYDDVECNEEARLVYVSTDDPQKVQDEINALPKDGSGNTITSNGCHKFHFIFSQNENFLDGFHIDGPANDDCEGRYARNIASVADLMLAAKADRYVGEVVSNWGRLVRIFRMKLNDDGVAEDGGSSNAVVKEMRAAFGHDQLPPGM